ncbi:transposase [Ktedonobacter racemifer]|uniref:transposase n=1 Tax=Ktedonobacter racemifer TaxID=363277 RepID=UPI001FCB27FF|nr:transposase [Ktedonobacter racemifer]
MTFDHDPRWVGSRSGCDFPSALCRFLRCVGVEPHLCPPHQPQKNAFVERLHRSLKEECLLVHRPGTLQEVCTVTAQYQHQLQPRAPAPGGLLPQSASACGLPDAPHLAALARSGRSGRLARCVAWTCPGTQDWFGWLRDGG